MQLTRFTEDNAHDWVLANTNPLGELRDLGARGGIPL
jgi:hypothetical protein